MGKTLSMLHSLVLPFNQFNAEDRLAFKNSITFENIKRLKIIAVIGSAINLLVLILFVFREGWNSLLDTDCELRFLWIIASAAYILIVGRPKSEKEVKTDQFYIFAGAAALSLMFSSLITANYSVNYGYTFLYIINIMLTGSFLYFSLLEVLAVIGPSFLYLLFTVLTSRETQIIKEGNWVIIVAVTLFSVIIAHMAFLSKLSQLKFQQIIQNQNTELLQLSELDGLTNIANRRKVDQVFEREWARSFREKQILSVMMLDIDHFKNYNDTYGHQAGDECLRTIVKITQSFLLRRTDFIGRYGGEEFIILLAGVENKGAMNLADRICQGIYNSNMPHASSIFNRVSVSIGVFSGVVTDELSVSQIVACADKAMYTAKLLGRNRVENYSELI